MMPCLFLSRSKDFKTLKKIQRADDHRGISLEGQTSHTSPVNEQALVVVYVIRPHSREI
jgi:hypothetical protein